MTGDMDYYGSGEHLTNGETVPDVSEKWYPLCKNKEDLRVCINRLPLAIERCSDWKTIGEITAVMLRGDTWYCRSTYDLQENEHFNAELMWHEDTHLLMRASVLQAPFTDSLSSEDKEQEESNKTERMAKFVKWLGEDRDKIFRDRESLKNDLRSLPLRAHGNSHETVVLKGQVWVSLDWLGNEIINILKEHQ